LLLEVPGSGEGPRAEDVVAARKVVAAGIKLYDGGTTSAPSKKTPSVMKMAPAKRAASTKKSTPVKKTAKKTTKKTAKKTTKKTAKKTKKK
jgi:hypothetical protein